MSHDYCMTIEYFIVTVVKLSITVGIYWTCPFIIVVIVSIKSYSTLFINSVSYTIGLAIRTEVHNTLYTCTLFCCYSNKFDQLNESLTKRLQSLQE